MAEKEKKRFLSEAGGKEIVESTLAIIEGINASIPEIGISTDGYLVVNGVKQTNKNLVGPQGQQGPKGDTGNPGSNGTNGTNGKDGVSCTHSWNGTTLSVTSASGTSSANLKGDKGDKGDPGSNGTNGKDGQTGPQGPKGDTPVITVSTDGYLTVDGVKQTAKNLVGPQGQQGPQGNPGTNGTTPTVSIDSEGYLTVNGVRQTATNLKGPQGQQGPQGPKGDTGNPGSNGTNGVSCTHSWNGTTLSVTSASGTTSANLQGPKGDKGDTGAKGDTGPQGPQGNPGTNATTTAEATTETKGLMSAAMVAKLNGIQDGANKYTLPNTVYGYTTTTTLANLPQTHKLILVNAAAGSSLSLSSFTANGLELQVIIKNTSSGALTFTIPDSGDYVSFSGTSLTVEAGAYAELNIVIADSKAMIRFAE